jgi:hypothetical protein
MIIEGPVGTEDSLPFGTALVEGTEASRLMKEFDFVEKEFFISGTANVPDARYIARISEGNPLRAGMPRFTDEQMRSLYGTPDEYRRRVRANLDEMVSRRWLWRTDVDFMLRQARW